MRGDIYGTRQAAANWFDMLKTGLEDEGFKQKSVYPFIFVRNNCIVIFYVDDFCIFYKDKEKIDALLVNISRTSNLNDEEGVRSYLCMKTA